MKAAVIKNNIVENIIAANASVFAELEAAIGAALVCVDGIKCDIGWTTRDGGVSFIPPEETEEEKEPDE